MAPTGSTCTSVLTTTKYQQNFDEKKSKRDANRISRGLKQLLSAQRHCPAEAMINVLGY